MAWTRPGAFSSAGYVGTYNKTLPEHLQRCVNKSSGRHDVRMVDTLDQMERTMLNVISERLRYKDLKRVSRLGLGARGMPI